MSVPVDDGSSNVPPLVPETSSKTESSQSRKGKRKESVVWEHFTKLGMVDGMMKSKCNYCGMIYTTPASYGTSTLKSHLTTRCRSYPLNNVEKGQTTLNLKPSSGANNSGTLECWKFNQDSSRKDLAYMVIVDGFPFNVVNGKGFKRFINNLQPRFKIPSHSTVTRDCLALYLEKKEELKAFFKAHAHRVCLTTNTWSSIQNLIYMCLTAHFVDDNWVLHKKILNFCPVSGHSGEVIGKAVERCLIEWGIEKVFTITVDNASSNDVAITYLKKKINNWKGSALDGKFLHMRCCAHVINLIVKDGLSDAEDSISKVRDSVKYARSSPSRSQKFKTCVERAKINSKSLVCLDVETRWNSTYLMLETACKFEKAFERLEDYDPQYAFDLAKKNGVPSTEDWELARCMVQFLRTFYDATLRVSGSLHVTSNNYFDIVSGIEFVIDDMKKSSDEVMKRMASNMKIKFDKYWGNIKNKNIIVFIAVVLDPRRKFEYLSSVLIDLYGETKGRELLDDVEKNLKELFDEYSSNLGVSAPTKPSTEVAQDTSKDDGHEKNIDVVNIARERYKRRKSVGLGVNVKTELDRYLGDSFDDDDGLENFDILGWWKLNSNRYKVLSSIARDVLAVPISSVASESAFSTGGRILDSFRSSLTPKTVEALICTQDWLRENSSPINVEEKLEDLMDIEAGISKLSMESMQLGSFD